MEDTQIVSLFLSRDEAAITETDQKYGMRLLGISKQIVQSRGTAEECKNDTYLRAWNTIPPQEPRNELFGYLARIIRWISLDVFRKNTRSRHNAVLVELTKEMEQCLAGNADLMEVLDARQTARLIEQFLQTLSPDDRRMMIRRYWYCDSTDQIARAFSRKNSTVRTQLFRLRTQLRNFLQREGVQL